MRKLPLFLILCVGCGIAWAQSPGVAKAMPLRIKPNARQPNVDDYYPQPQDREAYVVVSIDVNEKGVVKRAEAVDGFFNEEFAEAATKVAFRLRFEPATRNGVPVPTLGALVPIRFSLPEQISLSRSFRSALDEAMRLIQVKDWDG